MEGRSKTDVVKICKDKTCVYGVVFTSGKPKANQPRRPAMNSSSLSVFEEPAEDLENGYSTI